MVSKKVLVWDSWMNNAKAKRMSSLILKCEHLSHISTHIYKHTQTQTRKNSQWYMIRLTQCGISSWVTWLKPLKIIFTSISLFNRINIILYLLRYRFIQQAVANSSKEWMPNSSNQMMKWIRWNVIFFTMIHSER